MAENPVSGVGVQAVQGGRLGDFDFEWCAIGRHTDSTPYAAFRAAVAELGREGRLRAIEVGWWGVCLADRLAGGLRSLVCACYLFLLSLRNAGEQCVCIRFQKNVIVFEIFPIWYVVLRKFEISCRCR